MTFISNLLSDTILYFELLALLFGLFYFKKFKNSYWKWFIYYLGFIFISNLIHGFLMLQYFIKYANHFYSYFVIPLEFLFFYWLYAYNSLKKKKLFWIFGTLYLLSFAIQPLISKEISSIYSFNYIVGAFFLAILVIQEYMKQIKSDDIIKFKENMMFYINLGVSLFYIGTLPLFSFFNLLINKMDIYLTYYLLFIVLNIFMYILFICAIKWGKPNTY